MALRKKHGKIVVINHYGTLKGEPGSTRHYDMAQFFRKMGRYDIEYWLCGHNHMSGKGDKALNGIKLKSSFYDNSVKITKIKSTPYRNSKLLRYFNILFFDFVVAIKLLFSKGIRLIVLSMPPNSIFTTWVIRIKRIKLVADVEDLWPLFLQDMGMQNKLAIKFLQTAAKNIYKSADGIEAVSEGMLEYIKTQTDVSGKKMWVSPLGINLPEYDSYSHIALKGKSWLNYKIKIMYIGAHGKANDLEDVLHTASEVEKQNNEIAFVFVGDGDNKERIIRLANEMKINNSFFEDAIPVEYVPAWLEWSDICVTNLMRIPSFKLVRPNKLFQYMAAKKPIACGIWGESARIVEEAGAGIYIDFSKHALAAHKIIAMAEDAQSLKKMAESGRAYIEQNGDREKIFNEFYNHVLSIIEQ